MSPSLRVQSAIRRRLQSTLPQRRPQHRSESSSSSSSTTASTTATPPPAPAKLPLYKRLGLLTRAGEAYARAQRKRPYVTQIVSSLIVYGAADASAQSVGDKDFDAVRTGRSLVIGGIASIPVFHWFIFLSQSFNYPSRILSLAVKVAVNQAVFTPIFNSYFFFSQALLAGQGIPAAVQRVTDALLTSWINSCKLWPFVTVVNLSYVPLQFRGVFTGFVGIGWQTYLGLLNTRAEMEAAEGGADVVRRRAVEPVKGAAPADVVMAS